MEVLIHQMLVHNKSIPEANEFILDDDNDTTPLTDTDDQIDIKIFEIMKDFKFIIQQYYNLDRSTVYHVSNHLIVLMEFSPVIYNLKLITQEQIHQSAENAAMSEQSSSNNKMIKSRGTSVFPDTVVQDVSMN